MIVASMFSGLCTQISGRRSTNDVRLVICESLDGRFWPNSAILGGVNQLDLTTAPCSKAAILYAARHYSAIDPIQYYEQLG
jgi:hypothetical protein